MTSEELNRELKEQARQFERAGGFSLSHNRKSGAAARKKAARWRQNRRRMNRITWQMVH